MAQLEDRLEDLKHALALESATLGITAAVVGAMLGLTLVLNLSAPEDPMARAILAGVLIALAISAWWLIPLLVVCRRRRMAAWTRLKNS